MMRGDPEHKGKMLALGDAKDAALAALGGGMRPPKGPPAAEAPAEMPEGMGEGMPGMATEPPEIPGGESDTPGGGERVGDMTVEQLLEMLRGAGC